MKTLEHWVTKVYPALCKKLTPRIVRDLKAISASGESLFLQKAYEGSYYIFGQAGTGKTIYACQLLMQACYQAYQKDENLSFAFINVGDFFLKIKESYDKKDLHEVDIIAHYSDLDLLILDDLGTKKTTEWSYELLYILINRRYEQCKSTIFTSNHSLDELVPLLGGDRITSRIAQECSIIELTELKRKG